MVAHWNFVFSPLQAFQLAIMSSTSIGEPSPQTALGFSLKLITVGDCEVSVADTR